MGCEDYPLGTFLIARVHCGFQGSCSGSFFLYISIILINWEEYGCRWFVFCGVFWKDPSSTTASIHKQSLDHSVPPVDMTLEDLYALSFPRVPEEGWYSGPTRSLDHPRRKGSNLHIFNFTLSEKNKGTPSIL
jgi:hypothetical protein